MKTSKCKLEGIIIIEPDVFNDSRGFFLESYNKEKYSQIGIDIELVQDNHSASTKNTLRGMHYQVSPTPQAKLVRACVGEVYDVVVDIRKDSPTFGQWEGFYLSAENKKQVFIPGGFAHGFCVLSDYAEFLYKCSAYYSPKDERGFNWNDPHINIKWPISNPILSKRDLSHPKFKDLKPNDLFQQTTGITDKRRSFYHQASLLSYALASGDSEFLREKICKIGILNNQYRTRNVQ